MRDQKPGDPESKFSLRLMRLADIAGRPILQSYHYRRQIRLVATDHKREWIKVVDRPESSDCLTGTLSFIENHAGGHQDHGSADR
jgi:hypothetical protein